MSIFKSFLKYINKYGSPNILTNLAYQCHYYYSNVHFVYIETFFKASSCLDHLLNHWPDIRINSSHSLQLSHYVIAGDNRELSQNKQLNPFEIAFYDIGLFTHFHSACMFGRDDFLQYAFNELCEFLIRLK